MTIQGSTDPGDTLIISTDGDYTIIKSRSIKES